MNTLSSKISFGRLITLLVGVALIGALGWQLKRTPEVDKSTVYRIGYGNDAPFHFKEDDGEPSGLAFELVNEAALKRGIQLEWIQSENFDPTKLDLWVLMTIRPQRLERYHFTEPYLQSRSCFLVLEHSPFHKVSDLVNADISHVDYEIHRERLAENLPTNETVPTESSRDAVSALLEGKSDAAYLDQYAALRAVLEGRLATSVRVIDSHFTPLELALVSTFRSADVADTIRDGMKTLVKDGSASKIISRWNLFPNLTNNMVEGLVNAERRIRILASALICSVLALTLLLWLALRLRRQTFRLKKVQESLRQSAEHYRTIVENTNDIVYSVDGQGTIKFLSPQATRYGIDPKAAVSKNMLDFISDEDRERVEKEFKKTIMTGIAHASEFRLPGLDSTPVWLEERGSLVRDENGTLSAITGALRDITDRKRTEEALRESETKYRTFFENSQDPMLILKNGIFVDCNLASVVLLGYENKNSVIGSNPADLSPQHQPDGEKSSNKARTLIQLTHSQGSHRFEWEHERKDGSSFPVEISMTALPSPKEKTFLCVWRDISDRKHAEEEQRNLEGQLRHSQKMEAVGLLAGGIAHDFNNILATMMMNLDLLRGAPHLNETLRKGMNELSVACGRAAGLTRHLLTFSRRSVLDIKPLDLAEIVAGILEMIRRLLGENIEITFERATPSLPTIEADAGVLEQVLMNLCLNARDAMPSGGRIAISTKVVNVAPNSARETSPPKSEPFVKLTITDTGCGMDEETLKQIFDPFFTTKDVGKGTGLGLATVQGSIAQHGGWITAASSLGQGTVFEIFFPVSKKPITEPTSKPSISTASGNEMILVVEDEPSVRSMVHRALTKFGYKVVEASCGQEAIEKWTEHRSHVKLLLTDVLLPEGMTGLELAEKLRATCPELPVIVSSGYNNEPAPANRSDRAEMMYLPKPYTIVDLAETVRKCLDGK